MRAEALELAPSLPWGETSAGSVLPSTDHPTHARSFLDRWRGTSLAPQQTRRVPRLVSASLPIIRPRKVPPPQLAGSARLAIEVGESGQRRDRGGTEARKDRGDGRADEDARVCL